MEVRGFAGEGFFEVLFSGLGKVLQVMGFLEIYSFIFMRIFRRRAFDNFFCKNFEFKQ